MFQFANVKAIIFDLDDTLVETSLDFSRLKKEIGCEQDDDILSFIESIDCPKEKGRAHNIVLEHELNDARNSVWLPGALPFVKKAVMKGLPLAIVTRNCQQATALKITNNNIPIDLVLTRDDAPPKPDPTGLIAIARGWGIAPRDIAYIGDYIYDIQAAHNANMQAWLYTPSENQHEYSKNLRLILAN